MNNPPITESVGNGWTPGWVIWFQKVLRCIPWNRAFSSTKVHDFGAISAQSQATTTLTIAGARQGDAVQVTPLAHTNGIIYTGVVTADDTVTIYANNFSSGSVNPTSTTFRVIVKQT